jgi:hypothetical protein
MENTKCTHAVPQYLSLIKEMSRLRFAHCDEDDGIEGDRRVPRDMGDVGATLPVNARDMAVLSEKSGTEFGEVNGTRDTAL